MLIFTAELRGVYFHRVALSLCSSELAVPKHYAVAFGDVYIVAKGNNIYPRSCKPAFAGRQVSWSEDKPQSCFEFLRFII